LLSVRDIGPSAFAGLIDFDLVEIAQNLKKQGLEIRYNLLIHHRSWGRNAGNVGHANAPPAIRQTIAMPINNPTGRNALLSHSRQIRPQMAAIAPTLRSIPLIASSKSYEPAERANRADGSIGRRRLDAAPCGAGPEGWVWRSSSSHNPQLRLGIGPDL